MIRFTAKKSKSDGTIFVLGLSKENIRLLREGRPIHVFGADFGLGQYDELVVYYGETEDQMVQDLKKLGFDLPDPKPTNKH